METVYRNSPQVNEAGQLVSTKMSRKIKSSSQGEGSDVGKLKVVTHSTLAREVTHNTLNGIMKWCVHFAEEINCNIKFKFTDFGFTV